MRLHRFIGDFDLAHYRLTVKDAALLHQWKDVLRLAPGERVILCDGNNLEAEATIEALDKKEATAILEQARAVIGEPARRVTLYCAVLKRENFELVVQKCTEAGVATIVPIISQRTVKTNVSVERLQKIAHEAAEQSGRGRVPQVETPQRLTDLQFGSGTRKIFFDTGQTGTAKAVSEGDVSFFIGPEGGWDESEIAWAHAQGADAASLGPLTLRAETAAIVASFLLVHNLPI